MAKDELIEKIVDALIDPWTDNCQDYVDAEDTDLEGAEQILKDIRTNEQDAGLKPEECLPSSVTPELVMEAWNCLVRARKHDAMVERMAEWIEDNDPVCEYENYKSEYENSRRTVYPTDFLFNSYDPNDFPFAMKGGILPDHAMLVSIGMHSARSFSFNHTFCWYDQDRAQLFSSDHPFRENIINADAFAAFIVDNADVRDYFIYGVMDDTDVEYVFGKEAVEKLHEETNSI